jgi:hypothetical protein
VERTVTLRAQIIAGLIAGLAGGILLDLFLLGAQIANGQPAGAVIIIATFTFVASALGPAVAANPAAPLIGLVLHFCVSIGWALGYVYLVRSQPQLLSRPWVSGACFGIVVWVFMQIVLLSAGLYHRPSPPELATGLIAHIFFFGIPVALIVSRLLSGTPARA